MAGAALWSLAPQHFGAWRGLRGRRSTLELGADSVAGAALQSLARTLWQAQHFGAWRGLRGRRSTLELGADSVAGTAIESLARTLWQAQHFGAWRAVAGATLWSLARAPWQAQHFGAWRGLRSRRSTLELGAVSVAGAALWSLARTPWRAQHLKAWRGPCGRRSTLELGAVSVEGATLWSLARAPWQEQYFGRSRSQAWSTLGPHTQISHSAWECLWVVVLRDVFGGLWAGVAVVLVNVLGAGGTLGVSVEGVLGRCLARMPLQSSLVMSAERPEERVGSARSPPTVVSQSGDLAWFMANRSWLEQPLFFFTFGTSVVLVVL